MADGTAGHGTPEFENIREFRGDSGDFRKFLGNPGESRGNPGKPKKTLKKDLFIPLHIIYDKIAPDDPTRAPVIINAVFSKVKPIPAAAHPE